jgi:hypothetical protein
MAEEPKILKLKPSEKVYPWYGKSQKELNIERSGIPLLKVVNRNAHKRIEGIRNSDDYQAEQAHNAQSASQEPVLKGQQHGRFLIFDEPSAPAPQQIGRFTIKTTPLQQTTTSGRPYTISNANGGRRTRKHRRKNVSRLNRHVRNTSRNGAHHGLVRRRH